MFIPVPQSWTSGRSAESPVRKPVSLVGVEKCNKVHWLA